MILLPHTVTVHPSEPATDPDGNPIRRSAPVGVTVDAFVQPVTSTVADRPGPPPRPRAVAYLDPAAPRLDGWSRLVFDGATYETVGGAQHHTDPDGTCTHWRVDLVEVDR